MKKSIRADTNSDFEYRKVQTIVGDISFLLVLPKRYALSLGLGKGDFVRVHEEQDKIVIQKA